MTDTSALLDALLQETDSEDDRPPRVGECSSSNGHAVAALATVTEDSAPVDPPLALVAQRAEAAGARKTPTSQRKRAEIQRLRAEEEELVRELHRLQLLKQSRPAGAAGETDRDHATRRRTSALWLRVAKSQLERRQRSQVENLKLRHMLSHQATVMRGMQTLLRKRSTSSVEHSMSLHKRQCALADADAGTFARLESGLDAQYVETDAVLRESQYADSIEEVQRARVKVHATRGSYLEFFDAKMVPFGALDAGNAMWDGLQSPEVALTDGVYTTVRASADRVSAKLSIRLSGVRPEVLVDVKFVARRFSEARRVVIVWQCQSDTDGSLCGSRGVRLVNSGWTVVRGAVDPDAPTAIVQSCARVMPELPDDPQLKPESVSVLADLVTASFLRNMNAHHQRTEDILMARMAR